MLTHEDLKRLAAVSGPCLTIFEPLRGAHLQGSKPETGINAAIQKAEQLLTENGFGPESRDEMLRPLLKVAANTDWTGRKGSLVLFRGPGFTMANFWPEALAPRVHFGTEFLVLPLLPGLQGKHDFWVLALSIKRIRLFRGSRSGLVEVVLPKDVPASLMQDEAFDIPDHSLRGRSSAGPSVGNMKGVQFGTGSAKELQGDYLHDFFKAVDRGIHPILTRNRNPLILAGVTRELALYRKVNTYPSVLAGGIFGNPDSLGEETLFSKAVDLMAAFSKRAANATLQELESAAGRSVLIHDPAAVAEAAGKGQVEELIVSQDVPGFEQREDLINWAALATIRNSGKISMLGDPRMQSGVAAVLRFRDAAEASRQSPQYAH
ncbi:MAG TPA: hypothetical protein VG273_19660 [Bryobacteraceae bacterium]|nr:hypothetical protein [Bryobacteraceae bacterium]